MASTLSTRTIDGRTVRFLELGESSASRVLVLIHAFPMGAEMWEPQRDAFPGWRVIAPALPGFDGSDSAALAPRPGPGTSTPGPLRGTRPTYAIDACADHVLALLDDLGIDRPVVGGLSMGGYVTFGLLRRAPERASALILADTRPSGDSGERLAARHRTLDIIAVNGARGVADDMVPKLVSARTKAEKPAVVAELRRLIESQPAATIADATRAMMTRPESTALLPSIRVPTLIVVGEDDTITTVADAEGMHAAIKGSSVVRIPGGGHMSNMEDPAAFNSAVRAFLRTLADPPSSSDPQP
jgi:3-oxoadipate enol-lactonase